MKIIKSFFKVGAVLGAISLVLGLWLVAFWIGMGVVMDDDSINNVGTTAILLGIFPIFCLFAWMFLDSLETSQRYEQQNNDDWLMLTLPLAFVFLYLGAGLGWIIN